jgi:AsmA protein
VALVAILACLGLIAAFIAILRIIDLQPYGREAQRYMRDQFGRELTLEGPLRLSVWPVLAIAVPRASLSEPGSARVAASLEEATLSLSFLPLLTGRVVIEQLQITGLRARIKRHSDGSLNVDNLFSGPDTDRTPVSADDLLKTAPPVAIGQISVSDARLEFIDERSDARLVLDDLSLEIERLGSRVVSPLSLQGRLAGSPPLQGTLRIQGALDIDLDRRRVGIRGLEASLRGLRAARPFDLNARARYASVNLRGSRPALRLEAMAVAFKGAAEDMQVDLAHLRAASLVLDPTNNRFETAGLEANLRARGAGSSLEFSLIAPEFVVSELEARGRALETNLKRSGPSPVDLRLTLDAWSGHVRELTAAKTSLSADFGTSGRSATLRAGSRAIADLTAGRVRLTELSGQIDIDNPRLAQRIRMPLSGEIQLDQDNDLISAALQTRLLTSQLSVKLTLSKQTDPPLQITAHADRLDLDALQAGLLAPAVNAPAGDKPTDAGTPTRPAVALDSLLAYEWDARLSTDALRVAKLQADAVSGTLSVRRDRISVDTLRARLYGGQIEGHGRFDPDRERVALRLRGNDIAIGSLLRTAVGVSLLDGRADFNADLDTVAQWAGDAWRSGLEGRVRLQVREGALSGVDLAAALKQSLPRPLAAPRTQAEITQAILSQTGFTNLSASFRLRAGRAESDDLLISAVGLAASGRGVIDLNDGHLDWRGLLQAAPASSGSPSGLTNAMRRLQLPFEVTGTVSEPRWTVAMPRRRSEP